METRFVTLLKFQRLQQKFQLMEKQNQSMSEGLDIIVRLLSERSVSEAVLMAELFQRQKIWTAGGGTFMPDEQVMDTSTAELNPAIEKVGAQKSDESQLLEEIEVQREAGTTPPSSQPALDCTIDIDDNIPSPLTPIKRAPKASEDREVFPLSPLIFNRQSSNSILPSTKAKRQVFGIELTGRGSSLQMAKSRPTHNRDENEFNSGLESKGGDFAKVPKPVSSSSGWIKPKSKSSSKDKFFSVKTSSNSSDVGIAQNSLSAPGPSSSSNVPWVLEISRQAPGNQKRLKQTTLLDMSRNFPPTTVDLTTLPEYAGGERKITFGQALPLVPVVTTTVASKKRKSEEEDMFGDDEDQYFDGASFNPVPGPETIKSVIQVNVGSVSENEWSDDTLFNDPAMDAYLRNGEDDGPDELPPTPPKPKTSRAPTQRKKKEEEFQSTMELVRDFDKIPGRSPKKTTFKYKPDKAIRKKAERKKLPGWDCPECKDYWEGLESQLGPAELQRLKNKCSKHRSEHQEPEYVGNTPPDYWATGFPDTEEMNARGMIRIGVRTPRKK